MSKEELASALDIIIDEVKKIKKQYMCKTTTDGELGMDAEEGFEVLIERLERKHNKLKPTNDE